ncbi:MAG: hypothetical protein JJE36_06535 [Coriobacteriia bacterium]|nr:hypothetical protein [Coriobacteriia bacterium]
MELNNVIIEQRKKVQAELGAYGLDLRPVGNASAVDLLYISTRANKNVGPEAHRALDGATTALGYSPLNYAILSLNDIEAELSSSTPSDLTLSAAVGLFVDILDPYAIIILHADILKIWPPSMNVEDVTLPSGRRVARGTVDGRVIAACTDFFASLENPELKPLVWSQMLIARKLKSSP